MTQNVPSKKRFQTVELAYIAVCTALIAVYAPAGGTTQTWAESLDIPFVAFPAGQ